MSSASRPSPTHTFPVSWEELHRNARALAWRLLDKRFTGIVAVTRGGLVPAAIVARELDIRLVDTVCVRSYGEDRLRGEIEVVKRAAGDGEGVLIVDDLVDTGVTARIVREMLPRAHFATIYAKPAGRPAVDSFVTEVSQDTWIHFPWDTEQQFVAPLAKRGG